MCHGFIVERHGIDLAVLAIRQLCAAIPHVELRLYGGRTPFVDKVLALARQEGVANRVRYLGGMSIEKIVAAIDEADLGIIPNRRSIFTELNTPTRIFEYLSRGVPVIAPRAPGIQDYFAEQDMLYFELGDGDDLVRQIQYVFDHPREVADIVQRGQVIYRNHQWHEERQRLVDLVGSLVAPSAPR